MPRCVSKHANRLTTCCCSMPENCGLMPWWASDTRVPRWVVRVRLRKFYATARQSSFSPRSRSSGAIRPLSTCRRSEGNMVRSWLISVTTCLLSIPLVAQEPVRPAVTGRWDLTIVTNAGRRAPSWLEVQWSGNRVLVGQFVGVVGSVRPISQRGGNFVTDGTYGDFKLHLEFRYPPSGNSGVYLRGRYEAQIEDSTGRETSTGGLGAIYGFLIPNENAAKGAGEWQTYDITLIGRIVTVVLNGHQVICRATIPGITGGALDSYEEKPGPIMLQGDHGPVEYRNIVLTTAR